MLGKNQSGHIATIGFDLYCQMMEETVRELKGEKIETRIETELDLQIRGYIPKDYIPELNHRLDFYRRLQLVANEESLARITKEMKDRCGAIPDSVEKLLTLIEIKLACQTLHISRAKLNRDQVVFQIEKGTRIDPAQLAPLLGAGLTILGEFQMVLRINVGGWKENARQILDCLNQIKSTVDSE